MKQLLLQPEQVRFLCVSSKNKSKNQGMINRFFLIRDMEIRRYTSYVSWELRRNISESVRCCAFCKKRKTAWFMQANNQTRLCHISSNQSKRAVSCYIIQRDTKRLLSSRLSPFPSSSSKKKLFCLSVFTRKKRAQAFKTMSRNNKARSVDALYYNSVVLKVYNVKASLCMN